MKLIHCVVILSSMIALPTVTFAQSNTSPVSRAQVRAELLQLEQAGYSTSAGDNATYPAALQAAEATVAHREADKASDAVGGTALAGTSESGSMRKQAPKQDADPSCVGPVSFCVPFFGS